MHKANLAKACAVVLAMALAGCEKAAYEPAQQSGANPPLPEAKNFLVPPMKVPEGAGWAPVTGKLRRTEHGLYLARRWVAGPGLRPD